MMSLQDFALALFTMVVCAGTLSMVEQSPLMPAPRRVVQGASFAASLVILYIILKRYL